MKMMQNKMHERERKGEPKKKRGIYKQPGKFLCMTRKISGKYNKKKHQSNFVYKKNKKNCLPGPHSGCANFWLRLVTPSTLN